MEVWQWMLQSWGHGTHTLLYYIEYTNCIVACSMSDKYCHTFVCCRDNTGYDKE